MHITQIGILIVSGIARFLKIRNINTEDAKMPKMNFD